MPIKTTYLFVEWGRYLTSQWLPFIQIAPWLSVQTTDIGEYSISVVLYRSDDGETWKEHTLAYLESRWEGGEEEIYQVFIFNSKKYPSQTLEMNLMKKSYMASYVRSYITLYYILDSIDLMKKSYKRIWRKKFYWKIMLCWFWAH